MSDKEFDIAVDNYGWIKLSRKLLRNDLWGTGSPYDERSAWIYLLLSASYEKSEVYNHQSKSVITILPGQILTSIKSLAERWSWSYSKISRYLDNLEAMGMISQNRTTKYTIITLTNWSKYQDGARPAKQSEDEPQPTVAQDNGEVPIWKAEGYSSEDEYISKMLRGE